VHKSHAECFLRTFAAWPFKKTCRLPQMRLPAARQPGSRGSRHAGSRGAACRICGMGHAGKFHVKMYSVLCRHGWTTFCIDTTNIYKEIHCDIARIGQDQCTNI
jgi:hypothetical protein